ncbi:MAG: NADH-quinone oxidoreductase subunit J [Planctomycetaceae bacterium]
MQWLTEHWLLVLPMVLGAVAVAWRMPKGESRPSWLASLLGLAALGIIGGIFIQPTDDRLLDVLFYLFAGVAVVAAVLMITNHNPAYSALWFAVVTLAVCGLFLLQSAPFLASATVIVYAGAIIVTFLFVLMLAQQAGATNSDRHSRQPCLATFTGFVLLGALLFVLTPSNEQAGAANPQTGFVSLAPVTSAEPLPLSKPQSTSKTSTATFGTMRGLGRSLFGDYLFAVELAGTLLLIASIGAIVIAPKRSSGKL